MGGGGSSKVAVISLLSNLWLTCGNCNSDAVVDARRRHSVVGQGQAPLYTPWVAR